MTADSRPSLWARLRARLTPDLIVILLLFVALVAFSAFTSARQAEEETAPAYSTHSVAGNGTRALYLWLDELGYRPARVENGPFRLPDDAPLLFVLAPRETFDGIELRILRNWVRAPGHTLVVASDGWRGGYLFEALDAGLGALEAPVEVLTPTVPLLAAPPPGPILVEAGRGLFPEDDDFVAHLDAGDAPVLISRRYGQGRIFLTSAVRSFTNQGLHDPGSARLVYNLLAGLEPGARILFDEVHHGYTADEAAAGLRGWLLRSPWGWALLYSAAVLFGWLLLRGRRFGRPVPAPGRGGVPPEGEYVVSMARLFRRGGRRTFVQRHHHDRLKRELARPWRLNPDLPDAEFVAALARSRDDLPPEAQADLRGLLRRLAGSRLREADLVRVVGEVESWLQGGRKA
ncbi:MAG: DUF4350 domain-containing protein [Anaerolineae bacterium]|jgi:hypothetical protein